MHRAELAGFFEEAYLLRSQIIKRAKHSDRLHPSSFVLRLSSRGAYAPASLTLTFTRNPPGTGSSETT